ncbi:MAG: GTPase, partial [Planctomycetaceae bacterium]
ELLLSDTVGFVRDLPHHLVASFKSTLEEARHADLLLHVVDAGDPEAERQIETVNAVLDEIGVEHDNTILVLNKSDTCEDRAAIDILRAHHAESVSLSAKTGDGLDKLTEMVAETLSHGYVTAEIETGVENGRLFHYLNEHADVRDTKYVNATRAILTCRISRNALAQVNGDGTEVRVAERA